LIAQGPLKKYKGLPTSLPVSAGHTGIFGQYEECPRDQQRFSSSFCCGTGSGQVRQDTMSPDVVIEHVHPSVICRDVPDIVTCRIEQRDGRDILREDILHLVHELLSCSLVHLNDLACTKCIEGIIVIAHHRSKGNDTVCGI